MKKMSPPRLGKNLREYIVPRGTVAIAWLGQAGFVLKSPKGVMLAIDPYLSNSCEAIGKAIGVNMKRQIAPPLLPKELIPFDALVFTHSHQDHLDPETIEPYLKADGKGVCIAPHEASERLHSLGVEDQRIELTWPNHTHRVGDFTLRSTFAIPFGGDDLTHVGYLVEVRGGPRIYFTGDTDYHDILALSVAPYQPDIMVSVINPAFRNLSPREAAHLAKAIGPRWVIPCHHDLFPDNSLPDRLLHTNLATQGMADSFCPLKHGELHLFKCPPDRKGKKTKRCRL